MRAKVEALFLFQKKYTWQDFSPCHVLLGKGLEGRYFATRFVPGRGM